MATSFPTSLDALTNPTGTNTLASPDHAGQHSDANDAIEALQAKVGINSSSVATSLDYIVALKANLSSPTFTGTPLAPTATAGTNTTQLATTAFVTTAISGSAIPTASLQMFAGAITQTVSAGVVTTTAPTGWLLCDGNAISRSTYSALFTAVSTTYGAGDGSTTFNIPDMRSRSPIGVGTGTGLTLRTLGATGGVETVTLTSAQSGLVAHGHANTIAITNVATNIDHGHTVGVTDNNFSVVASGSVHTHTGTGDDTGINHNHVMPRQAIAATGTARLVVSATAADTSLVTQTRDAIHKHTFTSNNANTDHSHTANHGHAVTQSNAGGSHSHVNTLAGGVTNNTAADATASHTNVSPFLAVNFIIKT